MRTPLCDAYDCEQSLPDGFAPRRAVYLSGAPAAGIGLTSKSKLTVPGDGSLKFADGKCRRYKVTVAPGAASAVPSAPARSG